MTELPGQMGLFTLDGCTPQVQEEHADEECECPECVCEDCGNLCTSSKECVELGGEP